MSAYEEIQIILSKLPKPLVVSFAIYCAEDCFHLVENRNKASVRKIIDTTKAYMLGQVTLAELAAASSYASASSYAASAASSAAASYASAVFYSDTRAASYAAYYAALSFDKGMEYKLNEYLTYLKTMLNNLSNLERLIYDL